MNDAPELKPCPFCGGDMESFAGMQEGAFARTEASYAVECDCYAHGPFKGSMRGAVLAWNTRADTITALEAENDRLKEALIRIEDLTSHNMGMSDREERVVNEQARAALEGE